ncbi:MAG: ribosomal protein S18-alanine N-acetyltransferase [Clostridia bacterium]|nr:ribosomal protein S18-alanine N-acetyltransferase [Clostridia bacterium]
MESLNLTINQITDDDLEFFKDKLNSEFDDFWTYSILEEECKNQNTIYIVAKQDDEIVGFAGILKILNEANIMNIVVKKDKRKLGIGKQLLSELIKISKEQKMESITLEVNEHNIPAIALYEKFGFKTVGIRKKYYNNTDSAILMTLYL